MLESLPYWSIHSIMAVLKYISIIGSYYPIRQAVPFLETQIIASGYMYIRHMRAGTISVSYIPQTILYVSIMSPPICL